MEEEIKKYEYMINHPVKDETYSYILVQYAKDKLSELKKQLRKEKITKLNND